MKHIIGANDPAALAAAVKSLLVDPDDAGQRLDNFLMRQLKGVPKTHVYRIIRSGEVRVNSGRASADRRLLAGDVVTVSTRLLEAKDKSLRFRHDMHNEVTRELAASTVLVGVHLDLTTRRAAAFAPEIRARATSFLGEAGAGVSSATANSRAETRP